MSTRRKSKGKRKAQDLEEAGSNHVTFANPAVKRLHYTVTSDIGSNKTASVLARVPTRFSNHTQAASASSSITAEQSAPAGKPKTQTQVCIQIYLALLILMAQSAQLMEDFGEHFDDLASILLEFEADQHADCPCPCGRSGMITSTQCYDCTGNEISCRTCFVEAHLRNPFHWAEVWDTIQGFFVRHDISKLDHVIQLGHKGQPCPSPCGGGMFTVVEDNGIHSTRLSFCGCHELPPDKPKQLMRARLFPATTREPQTAFTFNMLKRFQLHNLESKKAAYDHLGAIRRMTDNSFTADVPVSEINFCKFIILIFARTPMLHFCAWFVCSIF